MNFYIILTGIIILSCFLFFILGFLFSLGYNRSTTTDNKINNEEELYEL